MLIRLRRPNAAAWFLAGLCTIGVLTSGAMAAAATATVTAGASTDAAGDTGLGVAVANPLAGQFFLDHDIEVYIPSTVHGDQPADPALRQQVLDDAMAQFAQWFGGVTAIEGQGAAFDDKLGKVVAEHVTIVYSFTDTVDNAVLNKVVAYVKGIKAKMTQSSVTLVVDGKMYFI